MTAEFINFDANKKNATMLHLYIFITFVLINNQLLNFMKLKKLFWACLFSIPLFLCSSCDPEPKSINEEELITTVIYTLTPSSGGDNVTMSFNDLDGDGGAAPLTVKGEFQANTIYNGILLLTNEATTPPEDITTEITQEAVDHQFFYKSSKSDLVISYNDKDANGKPIGLLTTLSTGNIGKGNITLTLRHLPNKSATNVSTGDITNAGGETDIEVTFVLDVK
jgi:hypothetical protein